MTRLAQLLALFALVVAGITAAFAAPAPEPDPVPKRWQLDVEIGDLRMAYVTVPGQDPKAYMYLTYRVTNSSGQDLLFAPAFDLVTDDAVVRRSGRDVPAAVTKQILELLENPFLEDQIGIIGMLLQGRENSKDGVVIWPAESLTPGSIAVYGAGFSGETRSTQVPDGKGGTTTVMLRKSLMLRYDAPGDLNKRGSTPLDRIEQRWVLR